MPSGDRRGPEGYGPMTGRGVGYCAGYPVPGYANTGPVSDLGGRGRGGGGRGFGGRGRGRGGGGWGRNVDVGWRRRSFEAAPPDYGYSYPEPAFESEVSEVEQLKRQAKSLAHSLKGIEKRLADLTSRTSAEPKPEPGEE